MSDVNDPSLKCIWGLVAACCVASVGFVIAFCADQANELKPSQKGGIGEQSGLCPKKEVSLALSRYADLVENSKHEISIINKALKTYSMEVRSIVNHHKDTQHEKDRARQSILALSYFQATKEQIALLREQVASDDLLGIYQELVRSYPLYSFEKPIKLDEIERACTSLEEHHSKVLESAEIMLPNLYGLLKRGKFFESTILSRN